MESGLSSLIKNKKVLIKPNLLAIYPKENPAITHPNFARAICLVVKRFGGFPAIGDSPALDQWQKIIKTSEYNKIPFPTCELKTPVEKLIQGKIFKNLILAKELEDFDLIINVPKFKTHSLTGITGAVKNLYGCIPGINKSYYHIQTKDIENFENLLIDLANYLQPKINIMDGIETMHGKSGPSSGKLFRLNLIGISSSPFALDYAFAKITSHDINTLPIFNKLKFYGLTPRDSSGVFIARKSAEAPINRYEGGFKDVLKIVGDYKITSDFKKINVLNESAVPKTLILFKRILKRTPKIDKNLCTKCLKCENICPTKAISHITIYGRAKEIKIDYNKCISCFCCLEVCKFNAVKIKTSFLSKLAMKLYPLFSRLLSLKIK